MKHIERLPLNCWLSVHNFALFRKYFLDAIFFDLCKTSDLCQAYENRVSLRLSNTAYFLFVKKILLKEMKNCQTKNKEIFKLPQKTPKSFNSRSSG